MFHNIPTRTCCLFQSLLRNQRAGLPAGCARNRGICPAPVIWIAVLSLWIIVGCARQAPSAVQASAPATPVVLAAPATVEVTRIVLSERIVEATPSPPHACAPKFLADASEIVVALLAPISEPASLSTALGVQTGLSVAVDEINSAGGIDGIPVRLWIGDTAGNADVAAHRAEESITTGCASALVSTSSSASAHRMLEVAHRYGIPFFVVDAADDDLTASGFPEIFRLAPTNSMLAETLAEWLDAVGDFNGDGERNALFLVEEGDAATLHTEWMSNELARRGFSTDTYEVMLPSQDFSSLVARLVMRPVMPDVIFIRIKGDAGNVLQRQLLENGIGPQKQSLVVATRSALQDTSFWSVVGPAGAYTVVARVGPWQSTVNEEGARFARSYERFMERWPDAPGFAAHDALLLLTDAMKRAPTLASRDLIAALELSDLELASGRILFPYGSQLSPTSVGQPAWAWHQWLEPARMFLQYTEADQSAANMAVIWPPQMATVAGAVVRPAAP